MDKDITNIRHLMLPVHHKDCLVSRFLLENVNTVELSLTKCWHDGHLVAESRLLYVDTVLDFTWGLGPANWLQLPHSADGCLLSRVLSSKAMIISNPLCLQWTFQFCQLLITIRLPGGDEMMLLGHRSLSLLSTLLRKISMLVFRNMLKLLLECCQCPGLMGQHNRYILMHVCTQQSQLNTEPNIQGSGHLED